MNDLISCLGEWTLANLRSLNVSEGAFTPPGVSPFGNRLATLPVVISLSKLRNLRVLNVSFTEFDTHSLEIVANDLPHLSILDISQTRVADISALRLVGFLSLSLSTSMSISISPILFSPYPFFRSRERKCQSTNAEQKLTSRETCQ